MIRIKICGITRQDDARAAVEWGADALGFIFYPKSRRAIDPGRATEIVRILPPGVTRFGVFVNASPETVQRVFQQVGLDAVQLHGDEPPETLSQYPGQVIKAIRVRDRDSLAELTRYRLKTFLLDTYRKDQLGGTGETFPWELAVEAKQHGRIILSGGLTPDNIEDAIRTVRPDAVDVSSGVETEPGVKDHDRLRLFIRRARKALDE